MAIFKVLYIFSPSEPSFLVSLLLLHRIDTRQQTIVEKRIRFPQINNVDLYRSIFGEIGYSEVEPLRVAFSVEVVLQQQIILVLTYLHTFIATLYAQSKLPL